jgi:uncharacterized protein
MPLTLHAVSVGTYLQILPPIAALIDKAEEHCSAASLGPEALSGACLAEDMWPFAKQVTTCVHHSAGTIRGLRAGVFGPDLSAAPLDFASLRKEVGEAIAFLEAVDPAEINGMIGRDMRFEFGSRRMDFTVEDFILTFSLPNFYFHATTAYGILRNKGLAIGKMDFLGQPRLKA